jgi:hypothetical protein
MAWAHNSLAMYGLLVIRRGWTTEQYRTWLRTTLRALVA